MTLRYDSSSGLFLYDSTVHKLIKCCPTNICDVRVDECSPVPVSVDMHIPLQGLTMPSGCIEGDELHLDVDWDFTLPLDPAATGFYGCQSFAQIIDTNVGTVVPDTPGDECLGSGIFSCLFDMMLVLNEECAWEIYARLLPQNYEGFFQDSVTPHGHFPYGVRTGYNGTAPGTPTPLGWPGTPNVTIPFDNATTCGGCKHVTINVDFAFS